MGNARLRKWFVELNNGMSDLIAIFVRGHGRNDCRDLIKFLICVGEINSVAEI